MRSIDHLDVSISILFVDPILQFLCLSQQYEDLDLRDTKTHEYLYELCVMRGTLVFQSIHERSVEG